MSGEVRIQVLWGINPDSENFMPFSCKELYCCIGHYLKTPAPDSNIHPIWKMSTCKQCIISSEERRWIKLIINAPLTFNELVLHFQDKAVLKLPFPGGQFPLARLSLSTRILPDTASVIELKSCFWMKMYLSPHCLLSCVHKHATFWEIKGWFKPQRDHTVIYGVLRAGLHSSIEAFRYVVIAVVDVDEVLFCT